MAEVFEINDPDQLEEIRLVWNALLPQTPRASFFHTFDWLQTYWKHFGHQQRLRVLVVQSLGKTIGIVPLCVNRERYHIGNVRVLTYPLSDWGMWYGPIGPNRAASMFMAMKHIGQTRRDWDMVDLRWTGTRPSDCNTTEHAMQMVGWQPHRISYQRCSVIRLADTDYETYFAGRSKKWRHEIRRQTRSLEQSGTVSFLRHRPDGTARGDDDPRWDLYDDCLHISQQSWQAGSTTGNTLCHEHVRDFLRECHAVAARLGMLDVAVLRINDTPTAFQYNYHHSGSIYGLRMGFDPEFSQRGVGKVLMNRVIEDSFQRGDRLLDLGIGEFDFKRRFRTDVETNCRLACYPWSSWRSQGVRLSRWLKQRRGEKQHAAISKSASG